MSKATLEFQNKTVAIHEGGQVTIDGEIATNATLINQVRDALGKRHGLYGNENPMVTIAAMPTEQKAKLLEDHLCCTAFHSGSNYGELRELYKQQEIVNAEGATQEVKEAYASYIDACIQREFIEATQ